MSATTAPSATSAAFLVAAQDHFLHGHLLTRWIVDYVDLEESLAVGSIAQEELAHAATLMSLLGFDDVDRDEFIYRRPAQDWHPTRLLAARLTDWPATVLRSLLLAHAAGVRSERMIHSADQVVRAAGEVLAAEQHLHVLHWERWARMLGRDPRTAEEFAQHAAVVLPAGRDVFGSVPSSTDAGFGGDEHAIWVARLGDCLDGADIDVGLLGADPIARVRADHQPGLIDVLGTVRSLRSGAGDGVRGLDR